jgi:hypothetical protein
MSDIFSNKFVADEKNFALLKDTMWGSNGIRQAEELASHFTITKDMRILDCMRRVHTPPFRALIMYPETYTLPKQHTPSLQAKLDPQ